MTPSPAPTASTSGSDPRPEPVAATADRPAVVDRPGPAPVRRRSVHVDTDFARTRWGRALRVLAVEGGLRLLRAVFAPTSVIGAEHLEGVAGPVVVVANHRSHADTMMILTTVPGRMRRRMVVAAAADYFFPNRVIGTATALAVGAVPVERDRVSRRTLELCHRLLGEGWSLTVYPEGGRSRPGVIEPFKPGAAWIARRAGVPVVPVHIEGTASVLPKGTPWPRRAQVRVAFGPPMRPDPDEDARQFGRRIEAAVHSLAP